jgi:adenine/guanine/hypoxanthine permease
MTEMTVPAAERPLLDRYFRLTEHGTTVRTEFIAGVTAFLTMV